MYQISLIFITSDSSGSGKDEVSEILVDKIIKNTNGVDFEVISLATPVILSYMNIYEEGRFDFYKIKPEKRKKLLEFSSLVKKDDNYVFLRKTESYINKVIDQSSGDGLFIIIPDCRYFYEISSIIDNENIDRFYCINVNRGSPVDNFKDRESQYPVFCNGMISESLLEYIELDNSGTIEELKEKVDIIFKSILEE